MKNFFKTKEYLDLQNKLPEEFKVEFLVVVSLAINHGIESMLETMKVKNIK